MIFKIERDKMLKIRSGQKKMTFERNMLQKVLLGKKGKIAVRVIRTCKE